MRIAAKLSSNMMKYYFIDEMSKIIDEEKEVTHEQLSLQTDAMLDDPKMPKKIRMPPEVCCLLFESLE